MHWLIQVDVETVMKQMKKNAETFKKILLTAIAKLRALDWPAIQKKYDVRSCWILICDSYII